MVNVAHHDTRSVTLRFVVILAIVAVIFAVVSTYVLMQITGSFYVASYYTISALFDAVGVDESGALSSLVQTYTPSFYVVVGISIIDGLIKIAIVGFVIASLINLIGRIDIKTRLALMSSHKMRNHYVLCGYSDLAEKIAQELKTHKIPFLVIEKDPEKAELVHELGYRLLHEDFTLKSVMQNIALEHAKGVLFLTESDYENMLGVLAVKHIYPNVPIIVRAEQTSTITKLHRAGAVLCIVPEMLAGMDIGYAVAKGGV